MAPTTLEKKHPQLFASASPLFQLKPRAEGCVEKSRPHETHGELSDEGGRRAAITAPLLQLIDAAAVLAKKLSRLL
jgi:hypothetical protein